MELLEFFVPAEVTLRNWGVYIILAEDIENKTEYISKSSTEYHRLILLTKSNSLV